MIDKCKKCGSCCKAIRIEISPLEFHIEREKVKRGLKPKFKDMDICSKYFKLITKKEAFEINSELKEWECVDKLSFFKCNALKNNKCSIHDNKPEVCHGFPYYNNKKLHPGFKFYNKNCGYNINESINKVNRIWK
jgi:Fe-S-cluster containining protein